MNRDRPSIRNDLYVADLSAWADAQVRALYERRFDDLDHDRLSAAIRQLAIRERRELRDRLQVILTGLLRWAEQVDLRCHGWAASIDIQRMLVARILKESPSLYDGLPTLIAEAYVAAKARAVIESGLFEVTFSEGCPFTQAEILQDGYFPDHYGDDATRGEGWWKRDSP